MANQIKNILIQDLKMANQIKSILNIGLKIGQSN